MGEKFPRALACYAKGEELPRLLSTRIIAFKQCEDRFVPFIHEAGIECGERRMIL